MARFARRRSSTSPRASPRAGSGGCSALPSTRRIRRSGSSTSSSRTTAARPAWSVPHERSPRAARLGAAALLRRRRSPSRSGSAACSPSARTAALLHDGRRRRRTIRRKASQNVRSLSARAPCASIWEQKGLKIEALGLRNAWRFSFDRSNGDLYIGDVGQGELEEINWVSRASPGVENYGWTSRHAEVRGQGAQPGKLAFQPVAQYSHSQGCSVTGGYAGGSTPLCAAATSTATTARASSGASSSPVGRRPASGASASRSPTWWVVRRRRRQVSPSGIEVLIYRLDP